MNCGLKEKCNLSSLNSLAMIVAPASHDVGHFGLNNVYLNATYHKLAITYNDRSTLENFHAATCFELLLKPNNNFIAAISPAEQKEFR